MSTARRILLLDIPAPCEFITSNQRLHWRRQAALTKLWRKAGRDAVPNEARSFDKRVHVTVKITKPRRGRYDPANYWPTVKAACDGALVDSGLLADDDHTHVDGPDMRHGGYGQPRLIISIEEAS